MNIYLKICYCIIFMVISPGFLISISICHLSLCEIILNRFLTLQDENDPRNEVHDYREVKMTFGLLQADKDFDIK